MRTKCVISNVKSYIRFFKETNKFSILNKLGNYKKCVIKNNQQLHFKNIKY